jgi:cell division inhibitor SepF
MSFKDTIVSFIGLNPGAKAAPSGPASSAPAARQAARPVAVKPRRSSSDLSEIYTVEMKSFKDCTEVSDNFREGIPVIVNMGALSEADSKQMLNYMLGLKEGLHGHLRRVTDKVWLLSPHNVDVNEEETGNPAETDDLLIQP